MTGREQRPQRHARGRGRRRRAPAGTGTWTPPVRAETSASGESAAPTVSSRQPRRAASAARPSGPGARPDSDTATTRSIEPTQPGSGRPRRTVTGTGEPLPASRVEDVGDDGGAAEARDDDRTRAPLDRGAGDAAPPRRPPSAMRTWAPAPASARRLPEGSAAARPSASSRSCSSSAMAWRPVPERLAGPVGAGQVRVRASSTSRTGMPVVDPVGQRAAGALELRRAVRALAVDQRASGRRGSGGSRAARVRSSRSGAIFGASAGRTARPGAADAARAPRRAPSPSSPGPRPRR